MTKDMFTNAIEGLLETAALSSVDEQDQLLVENARGVLSLTAGLELPRMLVLSTSHLQYIVIDWFDMHTDDVPPTFYPKGDDGWIIPIDPETPWSHMVMPEFHAIRALAESVGASWIMLDRDADTVEGLQTYEW